MTEGYSPKDRQAMDRKFDELLHGSPVSAPPHKPEVPSPDMPHEQLAECRTLLTAVQANLTHNMEGEANDLMAIHSMNHCPKPAGKGR